MKNVTKTNVLFATTVLVYIILCNSMAFIPRKLAYYNLILVLPELILLLPSLMYIRVLKPTAVDDVRISRVSPMTMLLTILLTVTIMPLVTFINAISSLFVQNSVSPTLTVVTTINPLWLNLIIIALLPAVVEEFIFRGLIFNGYKKRNPFKAVIVSAVLFGLIHMNINQFSYAFVLGIVLALLAYATGSLLPSILVHFLINGTSVVITHLTIESEQTGAVSQAVPTAMEYISAYATMGVIALIGLVFSVELFKAICKRNRGIESVKRIFIMPYRKENNENEGKILDGYFALGVGVCLVYITYGDIILPMLSK